MELTRGMDWFLAAITLIGGGLVLDIGGWLATLVGWVLILVGVVIGLAALRRRTQ